MELPEHLQHPEVHPELDATSEQLVLDAPTPQPQKLKMLKKAGIIIASLLLLWAIVAISTKKQKLHERTDVATRIDSLKLENDKLGAAQKRLDSINAIYQTNIDDLDWKINNARETTTIIKEYYRERTKLPKKYTNKQLDSFFKKRYNY